MTTSNIIELIVIVVILIVYIILRRYTSRRLDSVDGCGEVYKEKDVRGKSVTHL